MTYAQQLRAEGYANGYANMTYAQQLRAEGYAKGERRAILEIAGKLLKRGMPYEFVMEVTGLSRDMLITLDAKPA